MEETELSHYTKLDTGVGLQFSIRGAQFPPSTTLH